MASATMSVSAIERSALCGTAMPTLPARSVANTRVAFSVRASAKKTVTKTPLGPSGDVKFKVDASGRPIKGKGVYQFTKKYGANVDGYSPIYTPEEWAAKGDTFEGGAPVLALWALTFAGLLAVGALLVFQTSALA